MTPNGFIALAVQSVTDPREVARLLLALNLQRDVLGTALGLVVVLNALVFGVADQFLADEPGSGLLAQPFAFVAIQGLTLLGTIVFLTWTGGILGGKARFEDMAILLIWLQTLRLLMQAILVVVLPLAPSIGGILILLASAAGVWILINFIDQAHGLGSLLKAGLVLILGIFGMAVALSMVLAVLGITPNGLTGYV